MNRTVLTQLTVRAMGTKWNSLPDPDRYNASATKFFPIMLYYFNAAGWDVRYVNGEYSIPSAQLTFFLLTL